jgi:recombination protein RecA
MTKAEDAIKAVNKHFGKEVLKKGSDPSLEVRRIETGVLPIDVLTDGGPPRNRITEVYGDFSTLKSYVGLKAIAATQRQGGVAAVVDTEHAFDPDWAADLGVDVQNLIVEHPPSGEQALDVTEALVRGNVDLVIWDSVAATLPMAERDKAAEESVQPARLAAFMSRALRKINTANENTALLFINQTRMNIGVTFGSPETTPGGKSLPFYASYRLSFKKAGKITETYKLYDGEKFKTAYRTTGMKIKVEVAKFKLSSPQSEALFTFDLGTGEIDDIGYLISACHATGMVQHTGVTWRVKGRNRRTYKGAKELRAELETNEELRNQLKRSLLTSRGDDAPPKKLAVRRKPKSSSGQEPEHTPTRGQARSSTTARRKTN